MTTIKIKREKKCVDFHFCFCQHVCHFFEMWKVNKKRDSLWGEVKNT